MKWRRRARIAGAVHLAHAARAEGGEDFVRAEFGAEGEGHRAPILLQKGGPLRTIKNAVAGPRPIAYSVLGAHSRRMQ